MRFRLTILALLGLIAVPACSSPDSAAHGTSETAVAAADTVNADSLLVAAADKSRILGAEDAPVWLLIVSDFECPYCRMWHEQSYAPLVREYVEPGKVRMAFINLPLPNHGNAKRAAEAAMCAGVQGRFWQVADGIFKTQERWSQLPIASAVFDSLAQAHQVEMPAWRKCTEDHLTLDMVEADAARAAQIGIGSTPSFVVMRGEEVVRGIEGAFPVDTFRVVLDAALEGAGTPARP